MVREFSGILYITELRILLKTPYITELRMLQNSGISAFKILIHHGQIVISPISRLEGSGTW